MIRQRVQLLHKKQHVTKNPPRVIKWNSVDMVRNQSFLATVREIIDYSDEMDVVRIGIVGDMMSGKSTLAKAVGHGVHKYSKIPFSVRIFYKEDLKNFKQTLSKLRPANYVLIFDDVSFLKSSTSAQGISMIEDEVSTIRHMEGGQDVKIILIFNFHYPKALPPFLREFHFKYVTSIGTDNEKVIADNYGKDNVKLVTSFKMMRKNAITRKVWFEPVGPKKDPVKYIWRKPFIPVLFWNEARMRKIVTPTRQFIDEVCSSCNEAEGNIEYDEKNLPEIIKAGKKAVGKGSFMSALKIILHQNGYDTLAKSTTQGIRWIERERKIRNLPLSAFAKECGLEITNTKLYAKPFSEPVQENQLEA